VHLIVLVAAGCSDIERNPQNYKNDVRSFPDGVIWIHITTNGGFTVRRYSKLLPLGEGLLFWDGDKSIRCFVVQG